MKASRHYGKEISYACTLLFLFLLAASLVNAQPVSQTFNTNGIYSVPIGYSANVTIQAWGAGAGGGSGVAQRGGGGGGAYASFTTILPAGSYAVTVGTGGTVGNTGENSSFTSFVLAAGGSSTSTVTGGAGGTTLASTGTTKYAGGAGGNAATTGGTKGGGGGGGSATSLINGGTGGNGTANPNNLGGVGGTGNGTGGRGADGTGIPDAALGIAIGGGGGGRGSAGGVSKPGNNGQVIVSVNSILPVRLGNIKAYEKQGGIQIDWTVYSEENVSHYQIERSSNGSSFNALGEVLSRNSLSETKYGFFDSNPLQKVNFYRIKNIDLDGKSAYSNIVKINLDKNVKGINMYPNPVTANFFSFQSSDLAKGNYSVKVFAATGQEVYSQKFTHNGGAINQTLLLSNGTRAGMYSIILKNDEAKVMSKTIIVQ